MVPNFQSSFIPKEPTEEVFKRKKPSIVGILVMTLFIASIVISVGIFVYKGMVESDIASLKNQLVDAESSIDKKTINEMSDFSKKLSLTKRIVQNHQIISKFLDSLASSTVSTIQFVSFSFGNDGNGGVTAKLQGRATNYSSIALQENVLSKSEYLRSVTFSNLTLTDKGGVSFDLAVLIDPQIAVYSP